jgi:hypothetical protein
MARRKKSSEPEATGEICAWSGCNEPGNFRAPRAKDALHQYQYFCEDHIREFNKQWNYFEGMTEAEIYDFQRDATTGHRPTWRGDRIGHDAGRKLEEAFHRLFGERTSFRATEKPIAARDKHALAVMDLEHPADKKRIKSQYRELVKKYHPDVNRGNKAAEETFKKITHAYHHLMTHYVEP